MAGPIQGGSAMAEAAAVQNLMNPRRLMPCCRSMSPTAMPSAEGCMVNPYVSTRIHRKPVAKRIGARRHLLVRCFEDPGNCRDFDQLRDQVALLITVFNPPNARHASFS